MQRRVENVGWQRYYPLVPQHGKSKVPKLEDTIGISVDVIWLHIQMQHAIYMQKVQTLQKSCLCNRWLS